MKTNFKMVAAWMEAVGQEVPKAPLVVSGRVMELRQELVREEAGEAHIEFDKVLDALDVHSSGTSNCHETVLDFWAELGMDVPSSCGDIPTKLLLNLVKELADVLVVIYGSFAAIGVDADKALAIVMQNNFGKVAHGTFRDDGKLIVPPKIKSDLKKAVIIDLLELLKNGTN